MHPRASRPGSWITDKTDYPPEKPAFLMSTPTWCRKKAAEFGPHTEALITSILKENAMRNSRRAQAILRLAEKYSGDIEKVSERAVLYGNTRYKSIKTMLQNMVTPEEAARPAPLSELGKRFLRSPQYFSREVCHD
jgi:hypothetical protein